MATSCIFLCCRGDRELFLPREREVEVSSFGSLLKRKDMAKKKGPDQRRSEDGEAVFIQRLSPERGRRRGEKMWITVCFFQCERVASHPVITTSRHWQHQRSRYCPARIVQRTIGGAGKRFQIRHSSFSVAAQRPVCSWPSSFS